VASTAPESDWSFRIAPYAWVAAIDGDVGIGPISAPVDISISDTLDSLDMAYMGVIEVGYGKWSLGVDVVYGKTSQNIGDGGRFVRSLRYEQTQWLLTPVLAYKLIDTETYKLDFFIGARATILEAELTGDFTGGNRFVADRDIDWVDPIIGFRGQAELTERLFLRYNGDIGGFGVSSDFTWQAFLGLGYHVNDSFNVAVGYRGIGVDYSEDLFTLDTVTHGPVLGFEIKF
jgi:opacity protein-like surface antigen